MAIMLTDRHLIKKGTFKMEIINTFPKITPITAEAGLSQYSINTGQDFTLPNNRYLVGLGKVDAYGIVSPVASVCLMASLS